jgi:5-formyltetrahydrofolate cyclo-ligase
MLSLSKPALRDRLLQSRQGIDPRQWQERSQKLCSVLSQFLPPDRPLTLLGYQSFRQEPDLGNLFALDRFSWGMPRCVGKNLVWHQWQIGDTLEIDRYSIRTPAATAPPIEPATVDFMLVPCLAADRRGYRLGYGGGYYDRLLADCAWQQIPTIGIVFADAYLPTLPNDPWDRSLNFICTESAIYAN